jgi:hypothetical protein
MSGYEDLLAAAQRAREENRLDAARALAGRAYELRTGNRLVSDPNAPLPDDVYDPTQSEGVAQEFFEGVASGGTRIAQGVLETLALVPDMVADTDYSSAVTNAFENFRETAGIDPVGFVGKGAEIITQFVVPGVTAAKIVGGLSKAGRLNTAVRQIAAAGVVDAVVSNNDTVTLGDFFEGGPTETDSTVGLQGQEEAFRRLGNKLRIGAEGGVAQIVAPALIRGTGRLLGETALAVDRVPGLRYAGPVAIARGARAVAQPVNTRLQAIEEGLRFGQEPGTIGRAIGEALASVRYRGVLPEEVAEARLRTLGAQSADVNVARGIAARLDKSLDKVLKQINKANINGTPLTRADAFNTIEGFLTATSKTRRAQLLRAIPKELHAEVRSMRTMIDDLSKEVLGGDLIKRFGQVTPGGAKDTIENIIRGGLGSYMRRRYRIFENAKYKPDQATIDAAVAGFLKDRRGTQALFKELVESNRVTPAELGSNVGPDGAILGQVTRENAEAAAQQFLNKYQQARGKTRGIDRVAENRIPTELLITRKNLPDYQRALLGEVKNPIENFVATVADLAEFRAIDEYFGRVRNLADDPQNANTFGRMFRNTEAMSPQQKAQLQADGFRILGASDDPLRSGWGSLEGYAVPERIYRDLTRAVVGDIGVVGNSARSLYSGFLKAKGLTQFGATVLSPVTQIRNVTTAALFSSMQGNVGAGANLWESMRLVYGNLPQASVDRALTRMQELGVLGTQAELRELQDLIAKGFGYDAPAQVVGGLATQRRFGSTWTDNPIGQFVSSTGKKAESLYQAGDDVWKAYNYMFERNKLRNAMRTMNATERQAYKEARGKGNMPMREFLDEEAAYVVRNLIPNYNMAPEAIRFLRRMPVGNFIAFPYEIIRTGINTVTRGLEELANPNRAIQEIGMRRLVGATTTVGVIGPTLSKLAYATTDVTEEEMDAVRRTVAAPWERNARLIPTGRHEDGTPQYVNFSYSNPYDMLERVFVSAINKAEEGRLMGRSPEQIAFQAFSESFSELMAPFTEESIVTAALRDVLDPNAQTPGLGQLGQLVGGRGGRTITGAQVYNPQDSAGDKAARSFAHVVGNILPSIVPVDVRGGELEPSRFARGFVNSLGLNEVLGVEEEDRRGRERRLSAELARTFSGVTESESQASEGVVYRAFEFTRGVRESSGIFNSVARRQNATSDQLMDAYVRADEARYRVFRQFRQVVEDLQSIGMSDRDIRRILSQNNIGGVGAIMRNRYDPLSVSDEIRSVMRRNGTFSELPRREIQAYRQSRRGMPIIPAEEEPRAAAPEAAPAAAQPATPVVGAVSGTTPVPAAAPAAAPVVQAPQGTPAAAPSPTVLGSNPIDILRNMEIFQRQQPGQ